MRNILLIAALVAVAACSATRAPRDINDSRVFFAFDCAKLDAVAQENLHGQALYLKRNPRTQITIEGHTDERGTLEYNFALGALRAANTAQFLINAGITPERIQTVSYSWTRPYRPGTGEAVWRYNRNARTVVRK